MLPTFPGSVPGAPRTSRTRPNLVLKQRKVLLIDQSGQANALPWGLALSEGGAAIRDPLTGKGQGFSRGRKAVPVLPQKPCPGQPLCTRPATAAILGWVVAPDASTRGIVSACHFSPGMLDWTPGLKCRVQGLSACGPLWEGEMRLSTKEKGSGGGGKVRLIYFIT